MNAETVNLLERPYQEIVDDILTAIVGGVVNEPIVYDVKEDHYPLSQPARDVRSINGTRAITVGGVLKPSHQAFQKGVDFVFSPSDNSVVWLPGGQAPDDETIFYVDYFRPDSLSPLTDINIGSVTRTLGEAIGREISVVYQQINQAYLSAFVDTATGQSLDLVVSILGVVRQTKEFAVGLVTFFRDPAAGEGNISIPEGTLVRTAKGDATFVTTQIRTLQRGQVRIDVPVRADAASKGQAGVKNAGEITTLAQPITGIGRVTNFDATVLGAKDESDQELRSRAKAALQSAGKATLAVLSNVIFQGRAKLDEVWDPNSSGVKRAPPGTITLLVQSTPARFVNLRSAVNEARAAGVQATLVARYVYFKPRLAVRVTAPLTAAGKLKVVGQIIDAIQQYVDGLEAGTPANGQEMVQAIIKTVKEVGDPKNIRFKDVIAWLADVGRPDADPLVEALLSAIQGINSQDTEALRNAIAGVVSAQVPALLPSGRREPKASLVQGIGSDGKPTGQAATAEQIGAGLFRVTPSENFSVALDLEPADIVLAEH